MSSPVLLKKIDTLVADSVEALLGRKVKPFGGFPEVFDRTFGVAVRFPEETSGAELEPLIYDRLGQVAGFGLYRAIQDFFLHTTLLEGVWEGSPAATEQLFALVANDQRVLRVAAMPPITITFSRLVPAKGNLIMNSVDMLKTVEDRRTVLAEVYREYGLRVLPMDDILHSTLARLSKIEPDADIEGYLHMIGLIDDELRNKPLEFTSIETTVGRPAAILKRVIKP